jgi:N-methylhydantoinase A
MRSAGFGEGDIVTARAADMRYTGQEFSLRVPVAKSITEDYLPALASQFADLHELRYGHAFDRAITQIVSLRVEVYGRLPKPEITSLFRPSADAGQAAIGKRQVYFEEAGFVDCAVYRREALAAGAAFVGPAVVEEAVSTTLIHPGDSVTVDRDANLVISIARPTGPKLEETVSAV